MIFGRSSPRFLDTPVKDISLMSRHSAAQGSRNFAISKVLTPRSFFSGHFLLAVSLASFRRTRGRISCEFPSPDPRISSEKPPAARKLIFRIGGRRNCRDLPAGERPVKIYGPAILSPFDYPIGVDSKQRERAALALNRRVQTGGSTTPRHESKNVIPSVRYWRFV